MLYKFVFCAIFMSEIGIDCQNIVPGTHLVGEFVWMVINHYWMLVHHYLHYYAACLVFHFAVQRNILSKILLFYCLSDSFPFSVMLILIAFL